MNAFNCKSNQYVLLYDMRMRESFLYDSIGKLISILILTQIVKLFILKQQKPKNQNLILNLYYLIDIYDLLYSNDVQYYEISKLMIHLNKDRIQQKSIQLGFFRF